MMNPMRSVVAVAVLAVALSAAAEQAFVRVPPPVYGGLVKDYLQQAYSAAREVSVYARRASDGKLLASAKTGDVLEDLNYTVALPMLSASSTEVVGLEYGQSATFSFLDGDVMWANLATVTPLRPGFQRLDVTLGHDANKDGVADEYAAYMEDKMPEYGLSGAFDPEADYNRDGVKNRDHYLAGTNPFAGLTIGGEVIADQKCTISSLMNVRSISGDEFFAITFNALEEVEYSVLALDDLAKGWGAAVTVASREQREGEATVEHWAEVTGELTLYVPKGPEKRRFYKLVVGQW